MALPSIAFEWITYYQGYIHSYISLSLCSQIRTVDYRVAFKDVGPIRQLKVRLQENPSGGYFDGWKYKKVKV